MEGNATETISPQVAIENHMREIVQLGHYEAAHLFSDEGLPLAEVSDTHPVERDRLIELSLMFQEVRRMADVMGGISSLKEIILEGYNHKKIIFRFFRAFNQSVVLAVVVPPRKSYRGHTNKLVKTIEAVSA